MRPPQLRKLTSQIAGVSVASHKTITVNVIENGDTSADRTRAAADQALAVLGAVGPPSGWVLETTEWGGILIVRGNASTQEVA